MALEKDILPFFEWFFITIDHMGALLTFLVVVAMLILVSLFITYLRMVIMLGPVEGFYAMARAIAIAVTKDLPGTSPRRVLAVARLAVKEAIRRRVLIAFAIFALALLFAGLFLDVESDHPARIYLSFVLTSTEWLVLILAGMLSAFSIPNDVKNRTIHTVVTKPVRASEIVMGRILGFVIVNTVLLVLMGVVSHEFVRRGLRHSHTIEQGEGVAVETSRESHHRHTFTLNDDGNGETNSIMDHYHEIRAVGDGESRTFKVGPPKGALVARVPVYGKLHFIDRSGRPGEGISVGKEWGYRKYIEGDSLAAGVFTFTGVTQQRYPDGLPLDMNISVFRTFKGDIVSPISGTITIKNPTSGISSESLPFAAKEFITFPQDIPRKLKAVSEDGTLRDVDLFEELVDEEGRVEVWVQCAEPGQYYGMAQADIYLRGRPGWFTWNFAKAYIGIWLQMTIVTCFGVVFSTFLSGPVAMLATLVTYLIGYFKEFLDAVATGQQEGGGPLESLIRLITQKNVMIDLDMGPVVDRVVPFIDNILMLFVRAATDVFPAFKDFNTSAYVAYGYNISGNLLTQHCVTTFAFVLVLSIFGYFFLKSREIAG